MNDETPTPGELEGADNPWSCTAPTSARRRRLRVPGGRVRRAVVVGLRPLDHHARERIPNANPFQQNAGEAADYLLAPSEEASREVLASQSTEGENTRYVMVDSQMASPNSKFGAPVTFYSGNETRSDFNRVLYQQTEQGGFQTVMQVNTQRYHESQMIRLYEHYGSAVDPQPVVVDWETQSAQTASGDQIEINTLPSDPRATIRQFDNVSAARAYVEEDGSAQLGGVGDLPSERVEALEHHRLVHASEAPGRSPSFRQVQILQRRRRPTSPRRVRPRGVPGRLREDVRAGPRCDDRGLGRGTRRGGRSDG